MILSTALSSAYQRLGWSTAPDADVITRMKQFANDTQLDVMGRKGCQRLRRKTLPATTVADSPYLALPKAATRVLAVLDATNQRKLDQVSTDWIDLRDPGRAFSSSSPVAWALEALVSPVAQQPENDGQLTIASTSAADTQTAYVEVITTEGSTRTATVALTGITPVSLGPATSSKVINLYLASAAAGEVFLTDADTNEIARIGIGKTRAKYTLLEIYQTPATAYDLNVRADIEISPLVNDTDEPLIPEEHREVLIMGMMMREFQKREKWEAAGKIESQYERRIGRLVLDQAVASALEDDDDPGFSQLGPYYPAGT